MGLQSGGLIYGVGGGSVGAYIREEKHSNLQSVKFNTFLSFFQHKSRIFWHISGCARCEICLKLRIKAPEYVKLTIKLTVKTPLT